VLAGYGIAIPVGAIAVLIVTTAARESFRHGLAAGLGAATADTTYATVAVAAGSALTSELLALRTALHALGGCVLLVVALTGLRNALRMTQTDAEPPRPTAHSVTYLRFLGLTLINPLTVIYFSSIVLGNQPATAGAPVAFVVGVALASASWQILLATSGAVLGRTLIDRGRVTAAVIGYGLILLIALEQFHTI
jgi:threonine/homoserine/homoserine lactone efflux protein